jgi:hypothetical protein
MPTIDTKEFAKKHSLPTMEEWKDMHLLKLWLVIVKRLEAEHHETLYQT